MSSDSYTFSETDTDGVSRQGSEVYSSHAFMSQVNNAFQSTMRSSTFHQPSQPQELRNLSAEGFYRRPSMLSNADHSPMVHAPDDEDLLNPYPNLSPFSRPNSHLEPQGSESDNK